MPEISVFLLYPCLVPQQGALQPQCSNTNMQGTEKPMVCALKTAQSFHVTEEGGTIEIMWRAGQVKNTESNLVENIYNLKHGALPLVFMFNCYGGRWRRNEGQHTSYYLCEPERCKGQNWIQVHLLNKGLIGFSGYLQKKIDTSACVYFNTLADK